MVLLIMEREDIPMKLFENHVCDQLRRLHQNGKCLEELLQRCLKPKEKASY